MNTFESVHVHSAARGGGMAQNALELGLRYAKDRIQFGKALYEFPVCRAESPGGWLR
jgi:(2S)-methylsuccinyl-CoA dehydrogenase